MTLKDRLELANLIGDGSDARYLDEDNKVCGYDTVEVAVQSGRAFFVTTQRGILALDADDAKQSAALQEIADRLRLHGITPVVLRSGGTNRHHLFARVTPETLEHWGSLARESGIDVRQAIRPPCTPHRVSGGESRLQDPRLPREAIDVLRADYTGRPLLSDRIQRLILGDNGDGKYASVSEIVQGVALGAVNAGWEWEDFAAVLTDPQFVLGDYVLQKRKGNIDAAMQWLQLSWNKAETYAAASPASSQAHLRTLTQLQTWACNRPWANGRQGTSDMTVYLGLLGKARVAGKTRFDCSERELAILAGLARNTVHAALGRLQQYGFVTLFHGADAMRRHSATWELATHPGPHLSRPISLETCGLTQDPSHDLWRNAIGLGKTAFSIYTALARGPASIEVLAQCTGFAKRTIQKHLRTLADFGLVEGTYELWQTRRDADLDAAAMECGSAGRGALQEIQFETERRGWSKWQDALDVRNQELLAWGRQSTKSLQRRVARAA